ncbi:MAG TPA: class I SAM-dependent methyltransferase [Bryobacteraceae bacterium]|jgi:SAM-dependent methyltransferase|nr:class I SAM-dependent methyltransferase [Bryobacteraceae bacterium]
MVHSGIKRIVPSAVRRFVRKHLIPKSAASIKHDKYDAELRYWKDQLAEMMLWYHGQKPDWYGLPAPLEKQRQYVSDLEIVNAVITSHVLRPLYSRRLRLPLDHFARQRLLEIGSGPLVPILQFTACERHALDPLNDLYCAAGWPLYAYDAKMCNAYAEKMPYPDGYFDAAVSVNALDHVDNFQAVAAEIERVLKPGGKIYFEVDYHEPTVTEPISLNDDIILRAFQRCQLTKVAEAGKADVYEATGTYNPSATNDDRLVLWHGKRNSS